MPKRTSNPDYLRARTQILLGNPLCHWCGRNPATEADHLIEHDRGGPDTLDNLVPACKPCNSRRGQHYRAKRDQARQNARNNAITKNGFFTETQTTPTPLDSISSGNELAGIGRDQPGSAVTGSEWPRLWTAGEGVDSFAPLVVAWAKTFMQVDLFPWQVTALEGQLRVDADGDFVHREALVSTARQNGKSIALQALIGWALTELPKIWGRPVNILSVANRLDRAEGIHTALWPMLKETFDAKVSQVVGRKYVRVGQSQWDVRAATTSLHGGSYDLVVVDELFDVSQSALDEAIRPTMIARRSPLLSAWSTAGDQSSASMLQMREEALDAIENGKNRGLFFAEWSAVPGDTSEDSWGMANPALGHTITMKGLRAAAGKDYFLRAHLNQWVTARGAWLDAPAWDTAKSGDPFPAGAAVLAVDSSIDESRYVGVLAAQAHGQVAVRVAFVVDSEQAMWERVVEIMGNKSCKLLVTPSLEIHLPASLKGRAMLTGYAELIRYSALVQRMILEGRVIHDGNQQLREHILRAVIVKTAQGAVLSSQKSPGPIELARCMVWAVAETSRPQENRKPLLVVNGRV